MAVEWIFNCLTRGVVISALTGINRLTAIIVSREINVFYSLKNGIIAIIVIFVIKKSLGHRRESLPAFCQVRNLTRQWCLRPRWTASTSWRMFCRRRCQWPSCSPWSWASTSTDTRWHHNFNMWILIRFNPDPGSLHAGLNPIRIQGVKNRLERKKVNTKYGKYWY